jgi:phenylacetate-CoA ligase
MYPQLLKYLLIPAYFALHRDKQLCYVEKIERDQWKSTADIRTEQLERIKKLVGYAYENVPFYSASMRHADIVPSDISSFAAYTAIPFLEKRNIQTNLNELTSKSYSKRDLIPDASGGSTGEPTNFFVDRKHQYIKASFHYRHDRWTGWDIGRKIGVVWGAQRDLQAFRAWRGKILQKYLFRMFYLDAFNLSEEKVIDFVRILNKEKPTMLLAYANAIFLVSKIIQSKRLEVHSPKGIVVSAETLTDEKRSTIEKVFRCKVLNRYASREVGMIASECQAQSGLHIATENVYVEVVRNGKPAPPGELGEIVVTDLHNYAMPLIRYRTGDVGTLSEQPCSCGRGLPLLGEVSGRSSDFFVTRSNKLIHGEYFTHLFYGIPSIKRFRVVQESVDHVHVKIIPDGEISPLELNRVLTEIGRLMEQANVTIETVGTLEPTRSGKFIFTISKVVNPFQ